ncbi:NAD(P)/FAD-dependent oxidoreductase [Brevundimonas sp.]|uniref:NAD(P)/FAD-dependent oxidoreductase n=3 Tax=Brevundimonas sp. TaxID=1871086 RepID=UPI002FC81F10
MPERIIIIGAGHAGGTAAITLRELGFKGFLTVVGEEEHAPYERPNLSKGFLSGEETEPVWLVPHERWEALDVAFKSSNSAVAIDREKSEIRLSDGSYVTFDTLILATGGRVRTLPLPHHDAVHYLRTTDDARALASKAKTGASVLVVGGGVIGLEAASTLKGMGLSVVVIEASDRLLGRNIPSEPAQWMTDAHTRIGVEIRLGCALSALTDGQNGAVTASFDDGTSQDFDLVVVGIGIIPNTDLAEASGLSVNGGIVVGSDYRSPDDARIFAIGDVAARLGSRMETWAHAQTSARIAAHAILGLPPELEPTPWFWTDQCGHNLQILGEPASADAVIARDNNVRLYMREGILVAAICMDKPREFAAARRLIGKTLNAELAADPATDLRKAV